MMINDTIAENRHWAVPAISALMTLHHDYPVPRLSQVVHLTWFGEELIVSLVYGTCNVSGDVIESHMFLVRLHQNGAIGVCLENNSEHNAHSRHHAHSAIFNFLAGEITRETRRWTEDLLAWENASLPSHRANVLNLTAALTAYADDTFDVVVEKEVGQHASIAKIKVLAPATVLEITPAELHTVNLFIRPREKKCLTGRSCKKYRVQTTRKLRADLPKKFVDRIAKVSYTTIRFALLPATLFVLFKARDRHSSATKRSITGV